MASNSTNKRRRTAADTLHISNLPIGFIVDVSAYLPKPSRAILAAAFTSSSLLQNNNDLIHRLSPISTAIISAQSWNILDFEDVERELANKLTDDDIYAILTCINAHDMLKRLKLRGCTNITGIGLNPLRGSAVLKQIDLSIFGKHTKQYDDDESEPKISQEAVLPILDSIISSDGCSLKYILFPWRWRAGREDIDLLTAFQDRYNAMIRKRSNYCSHCSINMRAHQNWIGRGHLHNFICYDCLKPFCSECADETGEGNGSLNYCGHCEKDYCQECMPVPHCSLCSCKKCEGCGSMKVCDECGNAMCEDCINTCGGCNRTQCHDCVSYHSCEGCSKEHCSECYNGKEYDVKSFGDCNTCLCNDCKIKEAKATGLDCRYCAHELLPLILEENDKQKEELAQASLITIVKVVSCLYKVCYSNQTQYPTTSQFLSSSSTR